MTTTRLTFAACSLVLSGYCQDSGSWFEKITTSEGLAGNAINAITQDAKGFIWIGSEEGLTKYDGYSCIAYRHSDDDKQSLSDNDVFTICPDNGESLWIGTRHGLSRYDAVNDRFETFFHDDDDERSLSHNEVFALAKDAAGNIWIGTYGGGLDKMIKTKSGYEFVHHRYNEQDINSISSNQILSICFDKYGQGWVGTDKGLNILQRETGKFIRLYHQPGNLKSISDNFVYKTFADVDGTIWICGKGMLDNIAYSASNLHSGIYVQHVLPEISVVKQLNDWDINDFKIDSHGNGWIATHKYGVVKFIRQQGKITSFKQYVKNRLAVNSLTSSTIYCFFEDSSRVMWIGTAAGVSKYVPSKEKFNEMYFLDKLLPADRRFIAALLSDKKGRLWVTYASDTFSVISRKENNLISAQRVSLPSSPKGSDQVNVLYQSRTADIYIGTLYQGLFIIPESVHSINDKRYWININVNKCPGLPSNNIYSITEDSAGIIWIGTYKGLCSYNPLTKQMRSIYTSPSGSVVSKYIIRTVYIDKNRVIWCGTDDGIYLIKDATVIASYKNVPNDSTSLSHNAITVYYIGQHENIWIGTKQGLNLFDRKQDNFQRFFITNGSSNSDMRSLIEDSKGNLWIATNHGLVKYNLQRKKIYTYSIDDGLSSDEFITNAVCSDHAGIFYFGTNNGLVSFTPENITPNEYIPPVVITNINIFNKPLFSLDDTTLINTYKKENKLVLHYNQNFFSFEFAALNFINSAANHYTYTLEGVDRQWNDCGTQRLAGYTDIAPGHYVFKVKGANNDGIWNNTPATLDVIITPPWWKTWWFYTLCSIAACAVISLIYRIRLQQILKVYKLRSNIAKDLHDDVGSALSSIALLSSIAQDEKASARLKPQEIFSRISDTSKRMIDNMNDIVWTVNPANDRFGNMLIRMKACAVEMFEAKNIAFTIKISEGLDDLKIPMQIRKDYFLVFKEAVNNLVKYSLCSNAAIVIDRINHALITTIDDDGKGFDREIICSGNGLKNMQERADNMNGKLHIVTEPGKGTSITLIVPVT